MLDSEQRRAMLRTILAVAWCDGDFHAREQRIFSDILEMFQVGIEEIAAVHQSHDRAPSPQRLGALLPEYEDRVYCYEECVRVSYADGKLVDAERELLARLRESLQIDEADAADIEEDAQRALG